MSYLQQKKSKSFIERMRSYFEQKT